MAVSPVRTLVNEEETCTDGLPLPATETAPHAYISRLAELHDEAAETALIANLLGRVPFLAAGVAGATALAVLLIHADLAPSLTWLVLIAAGLVALMRAYVTAMAAPFDRVPLRIFARDLQAIMLYVGFAWGAGSFLALPPDVGVLQAVVFSVGACVLVAAIVRAFDATVSFGVPVIVLSATAAAIRPMDNSVLATAAILAAGALVMGAAFVFERWLDRPEQMGFATLPSN